MKEVLIQDLSNGIKESAKHFFKPLDALGRLKAKGCQMPHFKASDSNDQKGHWAVSRQNSNPSPRSLLLSTPL